ncbi:129aa long hypothetical protein [Pyrococcus horikoshii OT3]|uniref:Uncharacterized protein n=1 Tax=Pyrococcus horikoshii (strain ATCC 700860 / DSM 12428 / JCM 9974 / NBRC 100139 / OT-3) TaxID=70601 RepID=O58123_PYRHO|nr:129aa long hypothetical protein [Pyrococcus horikoshii OT3]
MLASPGGSTDYEPLILPRLVDYLVKVVQHFLTGFNPLNLIYHPNYLLPRENPSNFPKLPPILLPQHLNLLFPCWVTYLYVEHEPVHLGFGEVINTFELYRILSCYNHEGFLERKGSPLYGNLPLLHRFQ